MVKLFGSILLAGMISAVSVFGQGQKDSSASPLKLSGPTAEAIARSGSFEGKLYTNKLLGLTFLIPGGWSVFSDEQNRNALAVGRENVRTGVSAKDDEELDKSLANTQVLFQATPPSLGASFGGPGNSALLSSGVERLHVQATGEKYLEINKALVLHTPGTKIVKDNYTVTFDGGTLSGFDIEGRTGNTIYRQSYLATVRKNVAVFFVITYYDHKFDKIVPDSLKTLRFLD
jgi:hypothetical protein